MVKLTKKDKVYLHDLRIHTREYAVIRAQQYLDGSWFFPWLKKKK